MGGGFLKFEDYVQHHFRLNPELIEKEKQDLKREKELNLSSDIHTVVVYPKDVLNSDDEEEDRWR